MNAAETSLDKKRILKIAGNFLRIVMAGAFLYPLLAKVRGSEIASVAARIRLELATGILVIMFLESVVRVYRWSVLLRSKNLKIPIRRLLCVDYASTFLALAFPSSVSVDVFRAYGLAKAVAPLREVASSVVIERVAGFLSILSLCNMSLFLLGTKAIVNTWLVALVVASTLLTLFALSTYRYLYKLAARCGWSGRAGRICKNVREVFAALEEFRRKPLVLVETYALSIVVQFLRISTYYVASASLGYKLTVVDCLAYVPLLMLVLMVPISFAGLGVRENMFVYLLGKAGISRFAAFMISGLVSTSLIVSILPGGLIWSVRGLALRDHSSR